MPFLKSEDDMLKILATLTLANIVDEEENKTLITETGTEVICFSIRKIPIFDLIFYLIPPGDYSHQSLFIRDGVFIVSVMISFGV